MPLYEYQCQACHRHVEKIQKFSDAPLTVCPHCGGALERTLTAPAVQFKGSGWYKDLYSSAKPKASAGGGEGTSAGGEKGGAAGEKTGTGESAKPASAAPASPAPAAPSSSSSPTSGS